MNRSGTNFSSDFEVPTGTGRHGDTSSLDLVLAEVLRSVRKHLEMDVAFISEFKDGQRIFRHLDSNGNAPPITVGDSDPLDHSYCQRVIDGRLPQVIADATQLPEALELPVTMSLPVRAHISVPVCFSDGFIYGTFCCFSKKPKKSLNRRDLNVMKMFAEFSGKQIERHLIHHEKHQRAHSRIRAVIEDDALVPFYQPILRIEDKVLIGYEALTRFSAEPIRPPDVWFKEAADVGLLAELEIAALQKALGNFHQIPANAYLSLNVSPDTITNESLHRLLDLYPLNRLVLEITEHARIEDYRIISAGLAPLRARGLRVAVDDAGAGYSTFSHILQLEPDIIKLDRSLITNINENRKSHALASALVRFSEETGSKIVAEGIETEEELNALAEINVKKAQGYYLARPAPIENLYRQ